LKFLETTHLSAVSKSRDYFSRKQAKELYQQKSRPTFYKPASIPNNALLASYTAG